MYAITESGVVKKKRKKKECPWFEPALATGKISKKKRRITNRLY
jgi:hypothetical protein